MPASYELGASPTPRPRDQLFGEEDEYEEYRQSLFGGEDDDDFGQTPQTISPPEASGFSGGARAYMDERQNGRREPRVFDGGGESGRGGGYGGGGGPWDDWTPPTSGPGPGNTGVTSPEPENWEDWLKDYSQDWLDNPSRWDQPLVQDTLDLIDRRLADRRQEANNRVNEQMARRGLSRSSIAMSEFGEMEEDLERQRMQAANQLEQRIANTLMEDRQRAFQQALAAGQFGLDKESMGQQELAFWAQLAGQEGLSDEQKDRIREFIQQELG